MKVLNRSGQGITEMILLTAALLLVAGVIFKALRSQGVVSKLVDGPWEIMAGMIENGVWGTPAKTRAAHPNYLRRHISMRGAPDQ
jgi:hypothetical protein